LPSLTPIFGNVLVTDLDHTVDTSLSILERLSSADKARQVVSAGLRDD
jgi:hypothetical protein